MIEPTICSEARRVADYDLGTIEIPDHGRTTAHLSVIEWNQTTDRALFLCDENGVALHKITVGIQAPGFEFTAYLKSPLIRELDAEGNLVFEEIDPSLNLLIEAARSTLREHFRRRAAETTVELVENWKKEKIYPYLGEPKDIVERDGGRSRQVASNISPAATCWSALP